MDEMVGCADVLDDEVARWHVQRWQWQWILPEVLTRCRRLKAEADPRGGRPQGLLLEVVGKVGV